MTGPARRDITQLLLAWSAGDQAALEKLTPLVYSELHRLAQRYMQREKPGHVLQATALVHEAYVRLIGWKEARWQNRAHFFAISAQLMRRILVDYARSRDSLKRGCDAEVISLDEAAVVSPESTRDLVALDEALRRLETVDPRRSKVVELRYFGGLSVEETAEVLKVSPTTVMREWRLAKVWCLREISRGPTS